MSEDASNISGSGATDSAVRTDSEAEVPPSPPAPDPRAARFRRPDGPRTIRRPARQVTEKVRTGRIPLRAHPEWAHAFPWVVQGITVRRPSAQRLDARSDGSRAPGSDAAGERPRTGRGGTDEDLDFGLFAGAPAGAATKRWELLADETGCGSVIHARQLHGRGIALHEKTPPGLLLAPACDGHATRDPGALLAVSVADCVPVFVVAPSARAVMLLHAGWRGAAAGILEAGLAMLERDFGTPAREARIHLGPAICGRCYEVGREVHEALGLPRPTRPSQPVDLRRALADRAFAGGVDPAHLTVSAFCTRCAEAPFFSHRSGDAGRQIAVLGIAPERTRAPDKRMVPETSPGEELGRARAPRADSSVGLCSVCAHRRVTRNRRGSIFWLCRRSADDARFRRYPRLPVARCPGFEPVSETRPNLEERQE